MNKLNHIAFIMDGNGRWGKKKKKGRNFGHLKGVETVKKIVSSCIKLDIPIVTFYVFSSENWKRPKNEIQYLFKLIKIYFTKEIISIKKQGIKINIFGDLIKLPKEVKLILKKTIKVTKNNKKIIVNLAINYGSKHEILYAAKQSARKISIKKQKIHALVCDSTNVFSIGRSGSELDVRKSMLNIINNINIYYIWYSRIEK